MAEMPNIDPNFEPQSRPRSGTWPLNRSNFEPRRNKVQGVGAMILGATLEESLSQEMLANESGMATDPMTGKDDYLTLLSPDSMLTQSDLDSVLIGSPIANLVTDFSAISSPMIKSEPGANNNGVYPDYCTNTTITELSNLTPNQQFENIQGLQQPANVTCQSNHNVAASYTSPSSASLSKSSSPTTTVSGSQSTTTTSGATPKAKSTRKNAWGNMSYADLITQAIEASPEQRLTLAQVYEWMVKNVPYFKDKGDSNSSAGWKNSIRHNLSLHSKFKRIQNEGTGKSSWWVINHDAKPGKSPRRRAISMDNANAKYNRSRNKALAKQKAELIKKQKAGLKAGQSAHRDSGSWSRDGPSGLETTVSKALGSDYRPRASSNASSLGGRMSPSRGLFLTPDLEDDGAPPLSPLSGSSSNLALSTSLPSAFSNLFDIGPHDSTNSPSTIPEGVTTDQLLHDNLLESLASMDVVSSPSSYTREQAVDHKDISGMYMQGMNGGSTQSSNVSNNIAQNSPNLASLLQSKTSAKAGVLGTTSSNVMAKMEPQSYDMEAQKSNPYPYSDYQARQMNQLHSPPQYKSAMQQRSVIESKPLYHYHILQQNPSDTLMYTQESLGQESQTQQRQQANYMQQAGMQNYMMNQQQQQSQMISMDNQQQRTQYSSSPSNLIQSQAKFPSDINLDNQELFDSGEMDLNEVLRDIPSPAYNFGMDFDNKSNNYFQTSSQAQMLQTGGYTMGMDGSVCAPQQQQPALHPNPDVFITNPSSGNAGGLGMMMNNFPHQSSTIGATSRYGMQ